LIAKGPWFPFFSHPASRCTSWKVTLLSGIPSFDSLEIQAGLTTKHCTLSPKHHHLQTMERNTPLVRVTMQPTYVTSPIIKVPPPKMPWAQISYRFLHVYPIYKWSTSKGTRISEKYRRNNVTKQQMGPYSRSSRNFATAQILLFGPIHTIVHWLPNKRFAWPQSCESFVNVVPRYVGGRASCVTSKVDVTICGLNISVILWQTYLSR
jgi:hypothetical protein